MTVRFVTTRHLLKVLFMYMFNRSIMELNIIVMFVITRHLEHNNSTVICNLSMKEMNNCEHYNHKATTKGNLHIHLTSRT